MGYRGDEESARIAAANLLDNYREQWNETFVRNQFISRELDSYIFDFMSGRINLFSKKVDKDGNDISILSILNEAVMITPASRKANERLAYRVREYIRHISRRRPKPYLTVQYLRAIQQEYVSAISAHFTFQHQLVTMVLVQVFSNISLITKSSLVPKGVRAEMDQFLRENEEYYEEDDDLEKEK